MRLPFSIALLFSFFIATNGSAIAQQANDLAFPMHITYSAAPTKKIVFNWTADTNFATISFSKKLMNASTWGPTNTYSGTISNFNDLAVQKGLRYEYRIQIQRKHSLPNVEQYFCGGFESANQSSFGEMIVLIDSTYAIPLQNELQQLLLDLTADAWWVHPIYVSRTQSVANIKSLIQNLYHKRHDLPSALLIVGHVPVPYSGDLNPDGHPDHQGAWPTDLFYADIDGNWTDNSVNNTVASRAENQNIPGDGKYDQSNLPSDVELSAGRIDFYNLPSFSSSDTSLLQQYLTRLHQFKTGLISYRKRMLVDDNFGYFNGEAFAQNAYRNGYACVGGDSTRNGDYFTTLAAQDYLWSYACGGGSYTSAAGIGTTQDFSNVPLNHAFTMSFGSYFGDWDAGDNFLRAALAGSNGAFTNCWAGRPNWYFHTLSAGMPMATAIASSQNNSALYGPLNYGYYGIHTEFLGDPSLRQDYFSVCQNLSSQAIYNNSRVQLNWSANLGNNVLGYEVLRAKSIQDSFYVISHGMIGSSNFIDSFPLLGTNVYQVRAIRLEQSICGSYYNHCLGVFDSIANITPNGIAPLAHAAWNVYPSSITDNEYWNLSGSYPASSHFKLYDETGVLLWNGNAETNRIPFIPKRAGVYFLEANGVTKKIMKF
jgi:hypothetical protein